MPLKHKDVWTGRHKGISFEIVRSDRPKFAGGGVDAGTFDLWCHYIYLHERQVPPQKHARFFLPPTVRAMIPGGREWLIYDYTESAFADLEWHGGITYYEYRCAHPGFRVVCAGCDYNHYGDNAESNPFGLHYVEACAASTVNSLWEQHPDLLVRCGYDGSYHPLSDVEPWGDGYISAAGRAKLDAERGKVEP